MRLFYHILLNALNESRNILQTSKPQISGKFMQESPGLSRKMIGLMKSGKKLWSTQTYYCKLFFQTFY